MSAVVAGEEAPAEEDEELAEEQAGAADREASSVNHFIIWACEWATTGMRNNQVRQMMSGRTSDDLEVDRKPEGRREGLRRRAHREPVVFLRQFAPHPADQLGVERVLGEGARTTAFM